jgi:putative flippase GtrA
VRFLIAGGGAAALNWLLRFPLSLALPYPLAVLAAAVCGMSIGFLAYRRFVFTGSDRPAASQLRDFLAVNAASALLVTLLASLGRDLLVPLAGAAPAEAIAHAGAIAAGAVVNYLAHAAITFRVSRVPHPSPKTMEA